MLAYVFSHRPAAGVETAHYEDTLRSFHAALATGSIEGFIGSASFSISGFAGQGQGEGYADWYLLESSAALDMINEAAVSGGRAGAHDVAARMAVDGVGKLLSLANGEPDIRAGFEIRFAKPAGMAYADLYAELLRWTGQPGVSLWRRMMVLGPPPEFCMLSPGSLQLPAELKPELVLRRPI